MFQILKQPNIDFMGKRRLWLTVSLVVVVASVAVLAVRGLNRGIEFTGGTEIQIRYGRTPDLASIRAALGRAGIGNALVTTIGAEGENEIYIRIGLSREESEEKQDVARLVTRALHSEEDRDHEAAGLTDLNAASEARLADLLATAPGLGPEEASALAASISRARADQAIFATMDQIADLPGTTPEVVDFLTKRTYLGEFALRGQSYIGPAIGRELMQKALFAILGSLAGMLVYIWIRFQFQWGLAAVVALTHDALITLGLFSLLGKEMSLPVVAAFLTLIGYSVNDTVVVLDRVRENLRMRRASLDLVGLINLSINQTLSRTIITSGLTWIVVMSLFLFGGEALNPFAFVLAVGIVVGTYSSIYVASPVLLIWKRFVEGRGAPASAPSSKPPARKVRASNR